MKADQWAREAAMGDKPGEGSLCALASMPQRSFARALREICARRPGLFIWMAMEGMEKLSGPAYRVALRVLWLSHAGGDSLANAVGLARSRLFRELASRKLSGLSPVLAHCGRKAQEALGRGDLSEGGKRRKAGACRDLFLDFGAQWGASGGSCGEFALGWLAARMEREALSGSGRAKNGQGKGKARSL